MRIPVLLVAVVCILVTVSDPTFANDTSLRCGNNLISVGDTMYKVRRECGQPSHEQPVGERKSYRIYKQKQLKIEDTIYIVEWVYEKNQGDYILTFEGARLVRKEYVK